MLLSREGYITRVAVLGRYCYPERGKETALIVFSSLKCVLPVEIIYNIFELLPEPVKTLWKDAPINGISSNTDCITIAKEMGNYPYRAAAEKAFEVVFASIREILDNDKKNRFISLLPLYLKDYFERSKSCILDGSAEDFL